MITALIFKDLVFVGDGHSHALMLRKWANNPLPGMRITLISPQSHDTLFRHATRVNSRAYSFKQTHIDLVKFSLWANIRFRHLETVTAIDVESNTLTLKHRPSIEFDVVSIDIGSTPNQLIEGSAKYTTPVKPISNFYNRWNHIQDQVKKLNNHLLKTGRLECLATESRNTGQ